MFKDVHKQADASLETTANNGISDVTAICGNWLPHINRINHPLLVIELLLLIDPRLQRLTGLLALLHLVLMCLVQVRRNTLADLGELSPPLIYPIQRPPIYLTNCTLLVYCAGDIGVSLGEYPCEAHDILRMNLAEL